MIAILFPFCYTCAMKQMVVLCICITTALLVFFTPVGYQLVDFIITGHVPFTNISLSPLAMLIFWVIAVPLSIVAYRLGVDGFWRVIETIGTISQRHINRTIRWTRAPRQNTLPLLLASVLLYSVAQLPKSSAVTPELTTRRRFLPLPS